MKDYIDSHRTNSLDERLKSKKDFQVHWEDTHSTHQKTHMVWQLTKELGMQDINKFYLIEHQSKIGSGHYGVVRKCQLRGSELNKVYAVKTIEKTRLKGNFNVLRNEFELLRSCDHPNINQFYEIFQDERYFHFVIEYCEGGDVTSRVEKLGEMTEAETKSLIFQTLMAVSHLHSCGIIHRDIKPDNFLFKTKARDSPIKLIDFGLSKRVSSSGKLTSFLGTPYYVAPEVLEKRPYDFKVDVWSIGVMMYLLLTAKFPFSGYNHQETFSLIKKGYVDMYSSDNLISLSEAGKKFLLKLLTKEPEKRYSVKEALRDPWFDDLNIELTIKGREALTVDVLENLRSFKPKSTLVKEVIRLLVMIHDDADEVKKLKDAFFYMDSLNLGIINFDELKKAFEEAKIPLHDEKLHHIIDRLQLRMTNILTYTEFVGACISSSFYTDPKYLAEAFYRFDISHDNILSYSDIASCFARFGIEVPHEELSKIMTQTDTDQDGKISFDDFCAVMRSDLHSYTASPTKVQDEDCFHVRSNTTHPN